MRAAQEQFLARLLRFAKTEQVHIMLLAGDIFDSPEPDAFWLQLLQEVCAELKNTRIFIAPGNHDPYLEDGIWDNPGWSSNVHVFKPEMERKQLSFEGFTVTIDGQAFSRFLSPEPLFKPLPFADTFENNYRILLLHGEVSTDGTQSHYNPIQLTDPRYQAYDYLALGHVHKAQQFSLNNTGKIAAYPGIPQARGFDESGRPQLMFGHISLGTDGKLQATWREHSLATMLFIALQVDVSGCQNANDIVETCWKAMQAYPHLTADEMKNACWRIVLEGERNSDLPIALDYLSMQLGHKGAFYLRLYDHTYPALPIEALKEQGGFAGLIYKNYQNALKRVKSSNVGEKKQLEKALYYALLAHENQLSADHVERNLDAYHEYLAEVQGE